MSYPRVPVSDAEPELPLRGGALHEVFRVGDTVRRPWGPWTPTVHELLRHIRAGGFDLAPEPLGRDESGREILRFLPGDTVGWNVPWPDWIRAEELLEEVGSALAAYHRAVADFRPSGVVPWQSGPAPLGAEEIVCHHDVAPYNIVASGGRLQGIIDWDLAGPGPAVSDLAFAAWQWVPLHGPMVAAVLGWQEPVDRARRLQRLLAAYGLEDTVGFIDAVVTRIRYNRSVMLAKAAAGDTAYRALVEQGHVAGMDEALGFLAVEGPRLQAGL